METTKGKTMEIDSTTVETDAGAYRIVEHYDDHGAIGDPLTEYDHEGMELYVFTREQSGWDVAYSNLGESSVSVPGAGQALEAIIFDHGGYGDYEDVARRMSKWLAITGAPVTFVADWVTTRYQSYYYLALVSRDYPEPEQAVTATMREWKAWADGEVYGYVVEGPDGQHVDSRWGFIGEESRQDMFDQARADIEYDAKQRLGAANRVGAGFVGIV